MRSAFYLSFALILVFSSCSDKVTVKKVEDYRETWEGLNKSNYEMTMEFECDCVQASFSPARIVVEADSVSAIINPLTGTDWVDSSDSLKVMEKYGWAYVTINDIFDQISDGITDEYHRVEVDFHEELGYPRETYLDITEVFTDDHVRYTIVSLDTN